jgi:hypothetical protein
MKTPYDFISVAIFAAVVVLFLQRSISPPAKGDALWHYLVASIGCAIFNYLGNEGFDAAAIMVMGLDIVFIALVLKPLSAK